MPEQLLLNHLEQNNLLSQFYNAKAYYPIEKLFHELFEEQAAATPDNIVLIFKDKKLSYRDLNARSNQLARILRANGVKPDQIVGLFVEDNFIEMVTGMISILKAGGSFLPIDQDFPAERIEYLIRDSKLSILLKKGKFKNEFRFKGKIINLDDGYLFTGNSSNLKKINHPNDVAYVIYTSGSTGKPKGVQIEHTSIVNQIYGLKKLYLFESSLNHILLAPFTFDPSIQQVFLPLTTGGKLFLVPNQVKHNVKELWEFIVSNRIDIINTVPSLMNLLLDHSNGYDDLQFRYIILAGESFPKNLYLRLRDKISAEKIINIYGSTETTINTTLYECKPEELNGTIPIGKPLMNYSVFILKEDWQVAPVGIPGEICVSGAGLARGYLNNKKLTEEKFVDNPYLPGEKMYRTGDLGMWNDDGNIEFLGRIDHQVKINGMRVEPGEIESALNQHPSIRESLVVNSKVHSGIVHFIAYVVPEQDLKIQADELRTFLKNKLPVYMIPSDFVIMDSFPLTVHGKVDRKTLPSPENINSKKETSFCASGNEAEKKLLKIWKLVLGRENIGIKDNFFEHGGTSLLAMMLFSEIEKTFGKNLPLATIFNAPTIEQLAEILDDENWSAEWSSLVAIQTRGSNPPFFCVHGHRGNVIVFHDLAVNLGPEQPFYGLQAEGLDGKPVGDRSITEIASNYVKEIQKIQPSGPYFLGGWCMGGTVAYEMAQILRSSGERVALVVMIETNRWKKYPKRLPTVSFPLHVIHRTIDRIYYELSVHRTLGNKGRVLYLLRKLKDRILMTQVKIEKLIEWIFNKIKIKIPHTRVFKLNALAEMHDKAIRNYNPNPYYGNVVMFRANKQPLGIYPDPTLGWSEYIKGKLELYEFPGHHLNTFIEPSVKDLAQKLKVCIKEASDN
jgi:amino acid adenylation domain-containing protein